MADKQESINFNVVLRYGCSTKYSVLSVPTAQDVHFLNDTNVCKADVKVNNNLQTTPSQRSSSRMHSYGVKRSVGLSGHIV